MAFNFNYTTETVLKGEFINWMVDKLESNGWEYLSKGRLQDDYVFSSKGETGNDNIMFQFRSYYSSYSARAFNNSAYSLIGAKAIYSYTQASTASAVGRTLPAVSFTDLRLQGANDVTAETELKISYHINKDRFIIITHTPEYMDSPSSFFVVLGKPTHLTEYNEYNTSAIICSHPNTMTCCQSGLSNRGAKTHQFPSVFRFQLPPIGRKENTIFASELLINNSFDGDKFIIENILVSNMTMHKGGYLYKNELRQDRFKDEDGNVYMICPINYTSGLADASIRSLLIKVGEE